MNPLLVFFFIAMIIDDYLFKEGRFYKYLLSSVIVYWIFYHMIEKSPYHSASRKLSLASYSQSYDPTVYARVKFDVSKTKEFLKNIEEKTGNRITYTLFLAKVFGEALSKYIDFNQAIKFGALHPKKTVDLSVLVNVAEGKDLALVTLRDIKNKTFEKLLEELYPKANKLKDQKDEEHNKSLTLVKAIPSFLIAVLLELSGYLSNLGITIKALAAQNNQYGSMLISSVGNFKFSNAFAPLCPFTRTSGVITLCAVKKKKILNKDGSITEKDILPVNLALDHRYFDGAGGAKVLRELSFLFDNPEKIEIV